MRRSLRDEMPETAAFVDALREAFGEEAVTAWMRGQDGGWFCARENGTALVYAGPNVRAVRRERLMAGQSITSMSGA